MTKRGVLLSIIFSLALTIMLPFSISAESGSLAAPFVGFNVHIMDIDAEYKQIDRGNYNINPGSGAYVEGILNCTSPNTPSSTTPCDIYKLQYATNSPSGLHITFANMSITNLTNDQFVGTVYKRIYEVEFILDDSYVGYVTFDVGNSSYTSYVNGTSFHQNFWSDAAESFSVTITDYSLNRNVENQWNVPNESIISMMGLFQTGFQLYSLNGNDIHVPIFSEDPSLVINNTQVSAAAKKCLVILYTNHSVYNVATFNQWFSYNNNFELSNFKYMQRGQSGWIVQAEFTNTTNTTQNLGLKSISDSGRFTLFYTSLVYDSYPVSTDFALQFGLTNDYLNATTYGTQSSNETASDVTDHASDFTAVSEDIHDMESDFNSDLNTNLQAIDTTITPGTFGSSFLSSASWVKTQFDQLTSNTPFGSVLSFSLILGLGLLIVGRALK